MPLAKGDCASKSQDGAINSVRSSLTHYAIILYVRKK